EDEVPIRLEPLLLQANLQGIFAPLAADPVRRADQGNLRRRCRSCRGRAGGRGRLVGGGVFVASEGDPQGRGEGRAPNEGPPSGPTLPGHATASQVTVKHHGAKGVILFTARRFRKEPLFHPALQVRQYPVMIQVGQQGVKGTWVLYVALVSLSDRSEESPAAFRKDHAVLGAVKQQQRHRKTGRVEPQVTSRVENLGG